MNRPKLLERRHLGVRLRDEELRAWREIGAKLGSSSAEAMGAALRVMMAEENRQILAAQIERDREREKI